MIHYTKMTPAMRTIQRFSPAICRDLLHHYRAGRLDKFVLFEYFTADCMRDLMINTRRVIFR